MENHLKDKQSALFMARLEDAISISQKRPYYFGFLSETEVFLAKEYLKNRKDVNFLFWGGYDEAERQIIGFFPDFMVSFIGEFPLTSITIKYRHEDSLNHRDFLGSFMSLGIERTSVGDILVEEGRCVAFIKLEMLDYFLQNIKKIGRTGVSIVEGADFPLPISKKYEEFTGVISSERLDCIVAFVTKQSREKSASMIKSGLVDVNHKEILSVSHVLKESDLLSIRTKGRFYIDDMGKRTAKGRIVLKIRKFI